MNTRRYYVYAQSTKIYSFKLFSALHQTMSLFEDERDSRTAGCYRSFKNTRQNDVTSGRRACDFAATARPSNVPAMVVVERSVGAPAHFAPELRRVNTLWWHSAPSWFNLIKYLGPKIRAVFPKIV